MGVEELGMEFDLLFQLRESEKDVSTGYLLYLLVPWLLATGRTARQRLIRHVSKKKPSD